MTRILEIRNYVSHSRFFWVLPCVFERQSIFFRGKAMDVQNHLPRSLLFGSVGSALDFTVMLADPPLGVGGETFGGGGERFSILREKRRKIKKKKKK
jgi:hypothetical protein